MKKVKRFYGFTALHFAMVDVYQHLSLIQREKKEGKSLSKWQKKVLKDGEKVLKSSLKEIEKTIKAL
jgi:hypothetical protein